MMLQETQGVINIETKKIITAGGNGSASITYARKVDSTL